MQKVWEASLSCALKISIFPACDQAQQSVFWKICAGSACTGTKDRTTVAPTPHIHKAKGLTFTSAISHNCKVRGIFIPAIAAGQRLPRLPAHHSKVPTKDHATLAHAVTSAQRSANFVKQEGAARHGAFV